MPSQSDLRFTFQPLVGQVEFEVVSFELDEAISAPFQLSLELMSYQDDVDFGQLLDQPVLFTLWRGDQPLRYVHGLVSTFSQGETGFHRTRYRAVVEPVLARAGLRSNWRIFQQKTVPQILEIMLKRQGVNAYELKCLDPHQVREFCVQAGETDLDFMARLAAERHGAIGVRRPHDISGDTASSESAWLHALDARERAVWLQLPAHAQSLQLVHPFSGEALHLHSGLLAPGSTLTHPDLLDWQRLLQLQGVWVWQAN